MAHRNESQLYLGELLVLNVLGKTDSDSGTNLRMGRLRRCLCNSSPNNHTNFATHQIEGLQAQQPHQPPHPVPTDRHPFARQMAHHLAATVERIAQVQLVDTPHQRQGFCALADRLVVQRRAAQRQQPALTAHAQAPVIAFDHHPAAPEAATHVGAGAGGEQPDAGAVRPGGVDASGQRCAAVAERLHDGAV